MRFVHGGKGTRLYRIWKSMKSRCYNQFTPQFKDYGGRGILITPEWNVSFPVFRNWSLDNGYAANLQIDRINNDLGYGPANCAWVTPKENSSHKRTTKLTPESKYFCYANFKEGYPYSVIMEMTGFSKATVYRAIRDSK